jgi:aldehyde dehydrogenase (NAD+)
VGDPNGEFAMGPVVSREQYDTVQDYIEKGIDEGAELIAGGPGRPADLNKGFYVQPTVFVSDNSTTVAREEIFGPVLVMIPYYDLDHAVEIANDTPFGLAGFVDGEDQETCRAIAKRLRAGAIYVNGGFDFNAPFGGYKRSGNGREWGGHGFEEYLETKSILGHG